jgi:hypothetical protein
MTVEGPGRIDGESARRQIKELSEFQRDLTALLNKHSRENGSNTPDFILADYLLGCLSTFDRYVSAREKWYGIKSVPGEGTVQVADDVQ